MVANIVTMAMVVVWRLLPRLVVRGNKTVAFSTSSTKFPPWDVGYPQYTVLSQNVRTLHNLTRCVGLGVIVKGGGRDALNGVWE
jgi:hypothetical protein